MKSVKIVVATKVKDMAPESNIEDFTTQGEQEMNMEQDKVKSIYIGYHPRTHDGSSPKSRNLSDSIEVMDAFNKKQGEGSLRAEVVEIAFSDLCAVAVMERTVGKVWQYI